MQENHVKMKTSLTILFKTEFRKRRKGTRREALDVYLLTMKS